MCLLFKIQQWGMLISYIFLLPVQSTVKLYHFPPIQTFKSLKLSILAGTFHYINSIDCLLFRAWQRCLFRLQLILGCVVHKRNFPNLLLILPKLQMTHPASSWFEITSLILLLRKHLLRKTSSERKAVLVQIFTTFHFCTCCNKWTQFVNASL